MAYGLAYLHRQSSWIARDPTLYSAPFIRANQVATTVSLWCRTLEAARAIQQEMGYASYGHGDTTIGSYANTKRPGAYYAAGSMHIRSLHASRRPQAEDEVELRPIDRTTGYAASVQSDQKRREQSCLGRIEVTTHYGYTEHDRDS